MKTNETEIKIEVSNEDYSIYNGKRLIACETSKGDPDWTERTSKAIELVKLAGGKVEDYRNA